MGKDVMAILKLENLEEISISTPRRVSVDSSRRITLKGTKKEQIPMFDDYRLYYLEDGTVILRPLVVTEPENVIRPETKAMLNKSIRNLKKGKTGKAFDASNFQDLLDDGE